MIVFAGFTPHSPLLLPTVGKNQTAKLEKTLAAMEHLAENLYLAKPDTIVVLSTHAEKPEDAFLLNLNDRYITDLKAFGDIQTNKTFLPDPEIADRLQRRARKEELPLTLGSHSLDHGAAVPLLLLTNQLKQIRILPLTYGGSDPKEHVALGRILKDVIMDSQKRVALIASGDLAHTLSSRAPKGYKKEGLLFDHAVIDAIGSLSIAKLLRFDPVILEQSSQCAYRPLLMLFGSIERMRIRTEILSYEAPFGVGYLVAQFHLE